jgi:hypothetical protein
MCCGSLRSGLRAASVPRGATPPQAPPAPFVPARATQAGLGLAYVKDSPIQVRGPITGRAYGFAGGETREVEARDAAALLRTGLFRRV